MSAMSAEATVDEFIKRLVALDLDGAAELVSDHIEYDNVPVGKNHGPAEMKALFTGMMGGFEEIEFIIHRQTCTGNIVMNERTDRFRTGDRWIDLPVAGVFEVNAEGKISLWRDYFDMQMFMSQLAPPATT